MSELRIVHSNRNRLGEGPRWNADEQKLYWLDIEKNTLYCLDPEGRGIQLFDTGMPVGCLGFREAGGLVVAARDGFALFDPDSGKLEFVSNTEADKKDGRFNDGAVDPQGRFWAGTISPGPDSALYRLDPDYSVHQMLSGITNSNGVGWSPDRKTMYFSDTANGTIFAFDYDDASGEISNRRPFVEPGDEGFPDGLTVDSEGFVWSGRWGGWQVIRYDPDGKQERSVRLPAANVTACTFGGPDLTDLYITTAWSGLTDDQRRDQPHAGNLFLLRTDIKGQPENKFKG